MRESWVIWGWGDLGLLGGVLEVSWKLCTAVYTCHQCQSLQSLTADSKQSQRGRTVGPCGDISPWVACMDTWQYPDECWVPHHRAHTHSALLQELGEASRRH
jgi:hypothetical protein